MLFCNLLHFWLQKSEFCWTKVQTATYHQSIDGRTRCAMWQILHPDPNRIYCSGRNVRFKSRIRAAAWSPGQYEVITAQTILTVATIESVAPYQSCNSWQPRTHLSVTTFPLRIIRLVDKHAAAAALAELLQGGRFVVWWIIITPPQTFHKDTQSW